MSIAEKGTRSNWKADHLETMAREFEMGRVLSQSKLYKEERAEAVTEAFSNPAFLDMTFLPATVSVGSEGAPLPIAVIEELIRRSPHRIISKTCTCRDAHNCTEHDKNIGCIHIGANTAEEDERDLSKVELSLEMFEAFTRGYLRGAGGARTQREIELLPWGAKLMTLECGMRFLADHLNGDKYFKVHREGHNLDRARTQFALVERMERRWNEMEDIVRRA